MGTGKLGLSETEIVNRIMRWDNYLISIVDSGILKTRLLGFKFFNQEVEASIRRGILGGLYDQTEGKMKRVSTRFIKIRLCVFLCLQVTILIPFMLLRIFMSLFSDDHQFGSNRAHLNACNDQKGRALTDYGYWRLREYNEMAH